MTPRARRPQTSLGIAAVLLAFGSGAAAAEAVTPDLRPALLEISVNGQRAPDPQLILEDAAGHFYASAATLRQWRIRAPDTAPILFEGEAWYRLDTIPAVRLRPSPQAQSLEIEAEATAFELQTAAVVRDERMAMTPPAAGFFLNYDLLLEHAGGETNLNAALDAGFAIGRGVVTTGLVGGAGAGGGRLVRLESAWTLDRPDTLTTLRVGDGISSSGPGSVPVRFGGVQYGRNFAVQPGFLTMPLPVFDGAATLPGVVDVYVNNVLQATREIGPGPFQLTDLPVQSGGGTVQIVTRDLLGRETVSEQSYYASSVLLRRGLHDFSWEAGLVRKGFGLRSNDYGAAMVTTTHRYGLTDTVTVEGHGQANRRIQMAGIGASAALAPFGVVGATASFSHSAGGAGYRLAGSFERRTLGLSLGLRGEVSSRDYRFVGLEAWERLPRRVVQAFADLPFATGAAGINLLARDFDGQPDERLASLFVNHKLGRRVSLQFYGRRTLAGRRQTIVGAHAAFLFGARRSASAGLETKDGAALARISYQSDAPAGEGSGYRIAATRGTLDSADAIFTQNLRSASLRAHLAQVRGRTGLRLSAGGSLGMAGGRLFAARALGASFAAVKVGDYGGVRVYADNQLVAVTGADGTAIIPSLRPFERNVIRIEESDLPLDVQLASGEAALRPYARAVSLVRFAAHRAGGVLMKVRLEDGGPLPAGAAVTVAGADRVWVTASGGEVYVEDLGGTSTLTAQWSGGSCTFTATVPADAGPQPRIDNLICSKVPLYAVR